MLIYCDIIQKNSQSEFSLWLFCGLIVLNPLQENLGEFRGGKSVDIILVLGRDEIFILIKDGPGVCETGNQLKEKWGKFRRNFGTIRVVREFRGDIYSASVDKPTSFLGVIQVVGIDRENKLYSKDIVVVEVGTPTVKEILKFLDRGFVNFVTVFLSNDFVNIHTTLHFYNLQLFGCFGIYYTYNYNTTTR